MRKRLWSLFVCALMLSAAACGEAEEAIDKAEDEARETATSIAEKAEAVTRLTATLTGAAVPATPDGTQGTGQAKGDPDGGGTATVNVDAARGQVCYEVAIEKVDPPTGMHIHEGGTGEAGPVVIPLKTPTGTDTTTTGCADAERGLIGRIVARPGDFYVNVHTESFPAGAIRGQLAQ